MMVEREGGRATHQDEDVSSAVLGMAAPKIGDRVNEPDYNIQKKLRGVKSERVRGENRREKLAYVFDSRFDLDVWVHAEGEVLDRLTHAHT